MPILQICQIFGVLELSAPNAARTLINVLVENVSRSCIERIGVALLLDLIPVDAIGLVHHHVAAAFILDPVRALRRESSDALSGFLVAE